MSSQHERTDSRATTVIGTFRVSDYEHWRAGYEQAVRSDPALLSYRIWRGQDDPKGIMVAETFDSRSYAETAWRHEATREAMARDGIDLSSLQFEFYDEIGS
jgi:quinol monooxygenase YgiN